MTNVPNMNLLTLTYHDLTLVRDMMAMPDFPPLIPRNQELSTIIEPAIATIELTSAYVTLNQLRLLAIIAKNENDKQTAINDLRKLSTTVSISSPAAIDLHNIIRLCLFLPL